VAEQSRGGAHGAQPARRARALVAEEWRVVHQHPPLRAPQLLTWFATVLKFYFGVGYTLARRAVAHSRPRRRGARTAGARGA
jgi:hypothetical protein